MEQLFGKHFPPWRRVLLLPLPEEADHLSEDGSIPNVEVDAMHLVTTGVQLRLVLISSFLQIFSVLILGLLSLPLPEHHLLPLILLVGIGY